MKLLVLTIAFFAMTLSASAVVLKDKKFIDVKSNELQVTKVVYDFAKDKGAVASYELAEATGDIVVHAITAEGITSLDSAGDAVTVDVGVTGATNAFLLGSAQSAFAADALTATGTYVSAKKVATGDKVLMELKAVAATAGKIVFTIFSSKFGE